MREIFATNQSIILDKKQNKEASINNMDINIKIANEEDKEIWNNIVLNSPHGTIFHTWEWLRITEKHSGYTLYPLMGLDGDKKMAIFPVFYKKNLFIKSVFSPPPKTAIPYLGPVFAEYNELKQNKREGLYFEFQKEVEEFIKTKLRPHYSFISISPGLLETRPFGWSGYQVEPKYNYSINLLLGEERILAGFTKNLRQTLKVSEKAGVTVESGGEEELRRIYDMLAENYRKQKRKLPITLEYVLDIYRAFYPEHMNIFVAKHNHKTVGGMIDVHYKSKVYGWIGNTKNSNTEYDINELIQWKAIHLGCKDGLTEYEIIGANTPRLSQFKTKFNPELSIYFNATKYSSSWVKIPEYGYTNVLKPLEGRLKTKK
jgi:hypothetical protein